MGPSVDFTIEFSLFRFATCLTGKVDTEVKTAAQRNSESKKCAEEPVYLKVVLGAILCQNVNTHK